jgi:hypothetical protein
LPEVACFPSLSSRQLFPDSLSWTLFPSLLPNSYIERVFPPICRKNQESEDMLFMSCVIHSLSILMLLFSISRSRLFLLPAKF